MDNEPRDEEAGTNATTAAARAQRPRSSIPSFLFVSFILFMLTNHSGDEFLARHHYQDALQSLNYQLGNFTAWRNGTSSNFSLPEGDPLQTSLVDSFAIFEHPLDRSRSSYYTNITGFIHGDSNYYNITPTFMSGNTSPPLWKPISDNLMNGTNMTEVALRAGNWNWTASEKVAFSVVEKPQTESKLDKKPNKEAAMVHGRIELTDSNTSEDLRLEFEGVHFVRSGSIYGFAEPSGRHIDIRLLASIVPEELKNETASMIEPELTARIGKLKNLIDAGVLDQDFQNIDEIPRTTCNFTLYAQIEPAPVPQILMEEVEEEIQNPTGIWTVATPKLSLKGVLISKDCGILYEITNTEGLRTSSFFRKVTTYAGTAALLYLALLVLLSRQMEHSRTPAGLSRVSRWSFLTQALVDSVSFAGHITFAILAEGRSSLSLVAPAFLACVLFIHEAQFALLIHQIQLPEEVQVPSPAPIPATPTNTTDATLSILPTATVTPPPPSLIRAMFRQLRTDPQARLWIMLFFFMTFMIRLVLSPTLALAFFGAMYSSFWLPQIVRSVRRVRSSSLSNEYIVGTTVCRLYLALYFLACPNNVLDIEPRPWVYTLAIFVSAQVLVVLLQNYLGPTFFLPRKLVAVQTYDYHPSMPLPDPESPEQSLGDCAICMDAIVVDPALRRQQRLKEEKEQSDHDHPRRGLLDAVQMGVGVPARKNYSLAPCHHLFHTECLERWLAIKNICPQCRRPLPPL